MLFWILAGTLSAAVTALLVRPLLAAGGAGTDLSPDQAVYRDQMAEVDRDLARGLIHPDDAERARTEIARRLLAADRAGPLRLREAPPSLRLVATVLAAVLVVPGGLSLYATLGTPDAPDRPRAERVTDAALAIRNRPSQAEAEGSLAATMPQVPPALPEEEQALIDQLRRIVPTRPDDLRGWTLLAYHEMRLGDYSAAARAQERVVALKGEEAAAEDLAFLLDMLVEAGGGVISQEAMVAMDRLREVDPANPSLRYYQGLLLASVDRADLALPHWRALIEEAPPGNLHRRRAEAVVEQVAWLAGQDYQPPAAPGPTADDLAAAGEMSPEAQREMAEAMVGSLRSRLAAGGGSPEEWARLVTSLAVLGDREGAGDALSRALEAAGQDEEARALLDRAAREAGLTP